MSEVVRPRIIVTDQVQLEPNVVLEAARDALEAVVVIGWRKGRGAPSIYVASSQGGAAANLLIDAGKLHLIESVHNLRKPS